jgi:CubicO group peptidase (beta-lactamase class C family)
MKHTVLLAICFLVTPVEAATLNARALAELLKHGKEAESDAVVIMVNGRIVAEEYYGKERGPIEAMSCTKSIVSMAVGLLVDDGRIKSLDTPVAAFYPEWNQGKKRDITIRHLMTHTSGLQNEPNTNVEIYPSPDFVQLALSAELEDTPGRAFRYNNKALNLLAGVVQKASGKRLDAFLQERLFAPLGIVTATWTLDQAGNPHGMSGLQIEPRDLAKLGQLMLNNGQWNGKQLLSAKWVALSTTLSTKLAPQLGLLWWLSGAKPNPVFVDAASLKGMREANVDKALVAKLEAFKDKPLPAQSDVEANRAILEALGGEDAYFRVMREVWSLGLRPPPLGSPTGFAARGYLGQYLVVLPKKNVVAVRMYRGPQNEQETASEASGFRAFEREVEALVP